MIVSRQSEGKGSIIMTIKVKTPINGLGGFYIRSARRRGGYSRPEDRGCLAGR
jgi:hypothetical protein